jgi:hypothetical protein
MLARILVSFVFTLTASSTLWLAYAITEQPHWTRWLLAIGILEPIALFAVFSAVAVLVSGRRYVNWIRSLLGRDGDRAVA